MSYDFKEKLKSKMDKYAHFIYEVTKTFPKDELYGSTSQFRRSGLSVALNYIEGYARKKSGAHLNFLEISYASLKESEYLFDFCMEEGYLTKEQSDKGKGIANEIGAMLWTEISALEKSLKK